MQQLQVSGVEAGQRLDKDLAKFMPKAPGSFFYKMLRKKNITLNGKKAAGNEKLSEGDIIKLFLADETIQNFKNDNSTNVEHSIKEAKEKLDILFEDEEMIVINKPSGMLSQKARPEDISLVEYIESYVAGQNEDSANIFKPGICNRLDRNTTGLIVAGKTIRSLQYLNQLFREREIAKYYLCLVKGALKKTAHINGYLVKDTSHNKVKISQQKSEGAVPIVTAYEPLGTGQWAGETYTLLKVHLITGKSHQIRAHLQSIGHPIVGDTKYGEKQMFHQFKKDFGVKHQLLHAWQLNIPAVEYIPEKYQGKCFEAPLPTLFQKVIDALEIPVY